MNFKSLFFILFILPTLCYSQQWEVKEMGNAFDGFGKMCYVKNLETDEYESLLAIVNKADTLFLHDGFGSNGMNNLSIKLLFTLDVNVKNIKMSFDKEREYFNVSKFYHDRKTQSISFNYAFTNNYKDGLNKIDICNLLRSKSYVHFRVETNTKNIDFTFPLNGSSIAIGKTFVNQSYKKLKGVRHYALEIIEFLGIMASVNDGDLNLAFAGNQCIDYFQKNIGDYSFIDVVKVISSTSNKPYSSFIFLTSSGESLIELPNEIIFKNLLFFSGNPKIPNNKRYKKDIPTLEIYYEDFLYTGIVEEEDLNKEEFYNLNKEVLLKLYEIIKDSDELLDYFRIKESVFCSYEPNEYTFEVFIEPWGL